MCYRMVHPICDRISWTSSSLLFCSSCASLSSSKTPPSSSVTSTSVNCLLCAAASQEKKAWTCMFVSHSSLGNFLVPSGFLAILISADTWPGSDFLPVSTPTLNLDWRYDLTLSENLVPLPLVFCKAHPASEDSTWVAFSVLLSAVGYFCFWSPTDIAENFRTQSRRNLVYHLSWFELMGSWLSKLMWSVKAS